MHARSRLAVALAVIAVSFALASNVARADGHPLGFDFDDCVSDQERDDTLAHPKWSPFRRSAVPLPPLLYLSADRTLVEVAMLYWRTMDVEMGIKRRLVLPFYYDSCTPFARTIVTPFFASRTDIDGTAGFVGPYFFRRDVRRETDVLFPFFFRFQDRDRETLILGPLFDRKDAHGEVEGIFPLVVTGHSDDGRRFTVVPPLLLFHWRDWRQSTTVAGTFYARSHAAGGWDAGLLPIWASARHGERYYDTVIPPLFVRWGDASHDSLFSLAPLPWWYRGDPGGASWDAGVLPFYIGGRDRKGGSFYHVVPALGLAHWGDASHRSTVALNVYFKEEANGDWEGALFPLWFGSRKGHKYSDILLPPLYWRWGDRDSSNFVGLAPPSWYHRNHQTGTWHAGALPLYFGGRNPGNKSGYDVAPPLLLLRWENQETDNFFFAGIYRRRHRATGDWDAGWFPFYMGARHGDRYFDAVLPPLFWRWGDRNERSFIGLLPPTYFHKKDERHWNFLMLPLYVGGRSGGERWTVIPPLLFAKYDDGAGERTYLAGNFLARRHKDGSYSDTLFPIYWDYGNRNEKFAFAMVPPMWLSRKGSDGKRWDAGLLPFYFGGRDGESRYDVVPLALAGHWHDQESESTLAGPFFLKTYKDNPRDFAAGLFPLYIGKHRRGEHTDVVLPPLYWSWGDGRKEQFLSLAPAFHFEREPGRWRLDAPLLYHGARDGKSSWDVVPALMTARWRDEAHAGFVFAQTYWRRGPDGWDAGSLPLFASGARRGGRHYDAVLPPLYIHTGDGNEETTMLTPLAWHHRSPNSRQTALLPLFVAGRYDLRAPAGPKSYQAILPPLFIHVNTPAQDTTVVLQSWRRTYREGGWNAGSFPFYFGARRADGSYHDLVLPPLLMQWGRPGDHTEVFLTWFYRERNLEKTLALLPFYIEKKTPDTHFRMVTPLVYRWGDRERDHTMVFPLLYDEHHPGHRLFISPLVVAHESREEKRKELIVFPFFWHVEGARTDVTLGLPVWWDFKWRAEGRRLSIVAPLGFRYEGRDETTTLVLNTVYTRGKGAARDAWSFHFFPVLDLARYNRDHFKWQVLLGLFGRENQGDATRWRVFYFWTNPSTTTSI